LDNLKITVSFKSPVIMTQPIHFDAILSFALFQHTNDLDKAHDELPIERTKNIYHASALFMQSPVKIVNADFTGALRLADMDKDLFQSNSKKGKRYLYIDTNRGDHKAELNTYKAYESEHGVGYFYVRGKRSEIVKLLETYIFAIGKKHDCGFGAIEAFTVEVVDSDHSFYHPKAGVMRSLPIKDFKSLISGDVDVELCTFYPPYYNVDKMEQCFVPSSFIFKEDIAIKVDDFF